MMDAVQLAFNKRETIYNPISFGAVGNGIADDTTAWVNTIAAAGANGRIVSPPGKTYLLSSTLTISVNGVRIDLAGSTLKKKSTMAATMFIVSADDVVLRNAKMDGNMAAGATGVGFSSSGTDVVLENVSVSNMAGGYGVSCSAGTLYCRSVRANNNGTTFDNCDGFAAFGTGVMNLDINCVAVGNTRAGFFCNTTGQGHRVNGTFGRNQIAGVFIYQGDKGHSDFIYAYDNDYQGVVCDVGGEARFISDWQFGTIIAVDQGLTGVITSGANVEMIGSQRWHIGTIITRGGGGYALAFSGGAVDNFVGLLLADNIGGIDTDPGLTFQGSALRNHVGKAVIKGHSWALTISEENPPFDNNYNTIGELYAQDCPWGAASISGGSFNRIGRLVAVNCGTADPTLALGLVQFVRQQGIGGPRPTADQVQGNVIHWLEHRSSKTNHAFVNTPMALVYCDADVSRNRVVDGFAGGALTDVTDINGGNSISLRPMKRISQIEALDAGWSNGASNTTAGQFAEGTGGWRLVGTAAAPSISKGITAIDLSAMDDSEWFRITVNIENVTDKHVSTPILINMGNAADTAVFQAYIPAQAFLKNGLQYMYIRKGAFVPILGSPSWANIGKIVFFVASAGANTFAVTFDDFVRTARSQNTTYIDATRPVGGKAGDVLVAAGKVWVNDAGTWKSATVT
jgi:hypothetical protein